LAQAVERAMKLEEVSYAPFRLVLVDQGEFAELRSAGQVIELVRRSALAAPQLFTSSGLGDALVEGPRRTLFAEHLGPADTWLHAQDTFHQHSWPDRPHLSVCMSRADARTVSHTLVTVGPESVTLTYHPDAPDRPARVFALDLALRQ